ncbi:hypothetical protein ACR780_11015 [Sphingobacterium faecium]|jgi:hypothetical protein|nr:conserved hypothetical protein [Sphingobacterium sp. PM2-P1-29]
MPSFKKVFLFLIVLFFYKSSSCEQAPLTMMQIQKQYGGIWIDKKTSRCLQITFENVSYATITDWTRKYQSRESGDVYRAFVKNGRLVMPEDREHHAPYGEIEVKNNKLIYRTKPNGILKSSTWDKQIFTRER